MKRILFGLITLLMVAGCGKPTIDRSRALIVIDAGHGGHDCGAQCGGRQEKDAVLQIVKKVKTVLKDEGYRVYLTRGSDRFLTLGERTRIADKLDADVFVSIHANAIANRSRFEVVEGIETYFLQKTRDARSQRIATRENAAVLQGADALSKNVIIDSVLNGPKIIESNKLALDVQRNMMQEVRRSYPNVKSGGARPAPFYVLVGASRPSILVETGYITNTKDREKLFNPTYQTGIAKGIVKGVNNYLDNRKREMGF